MLLYEFSNYIFVSQERRNITKKQLKFSDITDCNTKKFEIIDKIRKKYVYENNFRMKTVSTIELITLQKF
mgnify:CR=1 FL=1